MEEGMSPPLVLQGIMNIPLYMIGKICHPRGFTTVTGRDQEIYHEFSNPPTIISMNPYRTKNTNYPAHLICCYAHLLISSLSFAHHWYCFHRIMEGHTPILIWESRDFKELEHSMASKSALGRKQSMGRRVWCFKKHVNAGHVSSCEDDNVEEIFGVEIPPFS
jgi:hypothetical protein